MEFILQILNCNINSMSYYQLYCYETFTPLELRLYGSDDPELSQLDLRFIV